MAMCVFALVAVAGTAESSVTPVARRVFRFADHTRLVHFRNGTTASRVLVTYVRYPRNGDGGPYPLVVFGHGFAATPGLYAPLLDAWAKAGYVVAAPLFPAENANAPGGRPRATSSTSRAT